MMEKTVPQTSLEFMRDPNEWPTWPVLPVKRRGSMDVGLMLEGQGNKAAPIVYLTNLFIRDFENCEQKKYEDLEGVVDDGWVVD